MTRPRQHIQHDLLCLERPGVCLCASSMYSMYAHTCNTHVNARARAHTARAEQTHSCKDLVRLHVRTCTRTRTHTRCIHAHTLNVNESPRPVSCAPTVMIKSSLPTASSCLPGPHVYMYVCVCVCVYVCNVCNVCMQCNVMCVCTYVCNVCMYRMYVCMYVFNACMYVM